MTSPDSPGMDRPFVSIVIPMKDEEGNLPACLKSLAAQSYPRERFELVFADGRSSDRSVEIVREWGARVVDNPKQIVASGRNVGFHASRGEIVAFSDADCEMDPAWIETAVRHLARDGVAGVTGPIRVPATESHSGRALNALFQLAVRIAGSVHRETIDEGHEVDDLPGCNCFYRREVLEEVFPVREDLLTAEDVELNARIREKGHRLFAVPELSLVHRKRSTWKAMWWQFYRFAIGRLQVGRLRRRLLRWPHVLVGLFLPSLLVAPFLLSLLPRVLLGTLGGLAAGLVLLLMGFAWRGSRDWKAACLAPWVALFLLTAWSAGFLREFFVPMRRVEGR